MTDLKKYHHNYYQKNKEKVLKRSRERLIANPDYYKNRNVKAKIEALTYYGNGKCTCIKCGESRLGCLSLDHINDNRTEETTRLGKPKYWGGPSLYVWLRKRNYPAGYQTLCMNCQWIKRYKKLITPSRKDIKPLRVLDLKIADSPNLSKFTL